MKLDITKIYIDSRFRTNNSKSETDLCIELPGSFNVPDGVIAHIDDIVIPVSWRTVDERNSLCYVAFVGGAELREANFTFDSRNYEGDAFAADLAAKFTAAIVGFVVVPTFICTYDNRETNSP